MDHNRENTTFFARLAYGHSKKKRSATGRPPVPQTSLIFELPDELILSILSHISPDPWLVSYHPWFHIPYRMGVSDHHQQRVEFLRPLSATCRAMRSRLVPWVWENLDLLRPTSEGGFVKRLDTIVHADKALVTSVKFMTLYIVWDRITPPPFIECLKSLPNLHTLFLRCTIDSITIPLKNALKGVKLPQIKTLILPLAAHPLLEHCHEVENVACVIGYETAFSDGFLRSLASNQDSKIKQLTIPLTLWPSPSRFVTACPRLTELTAISYYQYGSQHAETGGLLNPAGRAAFAISELVVACKALPGFDTLQIIRIPIVPRPLKCWCGWGGCGSRMGSSEVREQMLRNQTEDMKDWAIDCLKKPVTGCREGEERKRIALVISTFSPGRPCDANSAKVEEYEV